MFRLIAAALLAVIVTSSLRAQDMPLSQILIDNEGWKKVPNPGAPPLPFPDELADTRTAENQRATAYHVRSADGTLFVGYGASHAVWAFKLDTDRKPGSGAPFCPLRAEAGKSTSHVGAICVDVDGRIYAATRIGIQVFDPTSRLSGVITTPSDQISVLGFEGNQLVAWTGDTKYMRKLKTGGAKL